MESGSEDLSLEKQSPLPLIQGLPDDISFNCLTRVPRKYHALLKCVSKRWRDLVCSEEWHSHRRKHNLDETWIYALCRDKFDQLHYYVLDPSPSNRCWKRIQGLPPSILKRYGMGFAVLGKKAYLLGGCGWVEDPTDEVYCYDAAMNSWSKSVPLSIPRCYFACEVLDEKIYAIGGFDSNSSNICSWDTYDPCTNTWRSQFDPSIFPDIDDTVVLDGKIYIRCGGSAPFSVMHAFVYEPSSGTWHNAYPDMASGWLGPAVVVDGDLYVLDETSGTKLMTWRKDRREWVAVGRLSPLLTRPPCRLVAVGRSIFIIGKGLSTVVVDVDKAVVVLGAVMVTTTVPKLTSDEEEIISCKCVAI